MSNLHVHREVKQVCEQVTTYTFTLSEADAKELQSGFYHDLATNWHKPEGVVYRIWNALDKAGVRP